MHFLLNKRYWLKHTIAIMTLLMLTISGRGQSTFTVKGCVKDLPFNKIYFADITASRITMLDSTNASNGCFQFKLRDTLAPGMYSIILSREYNSFIRILLNHEGNLEFSTSYRSMQDSIVFKGSVENTVYYTFLRYFTQSEEKSTQLKKIMSISDKDTALVSTLNKAVAIQENLRIAYSLERAKEHSGTIAADFIMASTPIEIPAKADSFNYRMDHYLDHVNFASNALFHSDLLQNTIINYLSMADQSSRNFNEMLESYVMVMDKVMEKSAGNLNIYNFYRDRFKQWFMYGNLDVIATYNDKYYTEKPHSLAMGREEVRKRLLPLVAVYNGKKAPPINMMDFNDRPYSLDSLTNEYTLLVFYTSFCSHCVETLPKLSRLYREQSFHRLEVVAISFDSEKDAWLGFLKQGNYAWVNYSDLKGWNSDIAKAYHIKGTPTYILLDRNKYVINKPATYEELVTSLENLNLIPRQSH